MISGPTEQLPMREVSSTCTSPIKPCCFNLCRDERMAFIAKSTPVTSHPARAIVARFVPVPHPRSNARPGGWDAINSNSSGGLMPVSQGGFPMYLILKLNQCNTREIMHYLIFPKSILSIISIIQKKGTRVKNALTRMPTYLKIDDRANKRK
jgi:hypothetical protein